jgi:thiosulfate reductase cytochrome b subunit
MTDAAGQTTAEPGRRNLVFRHPLAVRLTHWINVVCLAFLLLSGLQIFNAHPALYWGKQSAFDRPLLAMTSNENEAGARGITTLFGHAFDTTGLFGRSRDVDGAQGERGFPTWLTIPSGQSLAIGRRWHFFFAWLLVFNGLFYLLYGAFSGHFRRGLAPTGQDLRHLGRSILEHARLRFPKGEEAKRYNVLQKLAYLSVVFVVLPVLILAGLAMSPGLDAAVPQLVTVFGGRQSARTVHFVCALLLVLFTLVHVLMVVLSGPWNNLRSMISGRYDIGVAPSREKEPSHAA